MTDTYTIRISPAKSMMDDLKLLFPGGPAMTHYGELLNCQCEAFWQDLERIIQLRHMAAMSGAMRWPWSQELRIVYERRVRAS